MKYGEKNLFGEKFDNQPVYNNKYIKTKINLYNTNFYGNKTPIQGNHYTYFSVILLYSIVNADKKYHPQVFLKEGKCAIKKKKIMNAINKELKLGKSDDDKYDDDDDDDDDEYICPSKC